MMLSDPMMFEFGLFAIKSTAILLFAATACRFLKGYTPAYRHPVWTAAFGAILLLPALELVVPAERVTILPATQAPQPAAIGQSLPALQPADLSDRGFAEVANSVRAMSTMSAPTTYSATRTIEEARVPSVPDDFAGKPARFDYRLALILLWVLGAFSFLTQQVISSWLLSRFGLRQSSVESQRYRLAPEKAGVRGAWNLVFGRVAGAPGPMTYGIFRPVVAMPETSKTWPADQFETVLTHELVHVRRHDCLTQALAIVACSLNWFNPIAWLCLKALRAEAEAATDDAVLQSGIKPSVYADALLNVAREAQSRRRYFLLAGVPLMKQSKIEARVRAILNPQRRTTGLTRLGVALTLGAALLIAEPCAGLQAGQAKPGSGPQHSKQPTHSARKARRRVARSYSHKIEGRVRHSKLVIRDAALGKDNVLTLSGTAQDDQTVAELVQKMATDSAYENVNLRYDNKVVVHGKSRQQFLIRAHDVPGKNGAREAQVLIGADAELQAANKAAAEQDRDLVLRQESLAEAQVKVAESAKEKADRAAAFSDTQKAEKEQEELERSTAQREVLRADADTAAKQTVERARVELRQSQADQHRNEAEFQDRIQGLAAEKAELEAQKDRISSDSFRNRAYRDSVRSEADKAQSDAARKQNQKFQDEVQMQARKTTERVEQALIKLRRYESLDSRARTDAVANARREIAAAKLREEEARSQAGRRDKTSLAEATAEIEAARAQVLAARGALNRGAREYRHAYIQAARARTRKTKLSH